jgi:hypothetical protein
MCVARAHNTARHASVWPAIGDARVWSCAATSSRTWRSSVDSVLCTCFSRSFMEAAAGCCCCCCCRCCVAASGNGAAPGCVPSTADMRAWRVRVRVRKVRWRGGHDGVVCKRGGCRHHARGMHTGHTGHTQHTPSLLSHSSNPTPGPTEMYPFWYPYSTTSVSMCNLLHPQVNSSP